MLIANNYRNILKGCGINYKNLEYLEEGDYTILMKNDCTKLGDMITFRHFHRKWKNCDVSFLNSDLNFGKPSLYFQYSGSVFFIILFHNRLIDNLKEKNEITT